MFKSVPLAIIYQSETARPLVGGNVMRLAGSMSEVGLLCPISVKPVRRFHLGVMSDCYEIIAGGHRYQAACDLRWDEIDCKVFETMDDLHIELAEIDENLVRANLSSAQEASAMSRRKEIYEELHPETKHGAVGNGRVADFATLRFTKATADVTGKSERTVQEAVARGKHLGADADLVVGTSLDSIRELDALAKLPPEERKPLIDRARAGEKVSAKSAIKMAADPLDDVQAAEKQVGRLMDAWNAAGQDARQEFLCRIDQPIMDRRFG